MLTFSSEAHVYKWDEKPVPSVTQIIQEWIPINVYGVEYFCNTFTGTVLAAERFREASDFGRAVHKAAHLYVADTLDEENLHPRLMTVMRQFHLWMEQYKPTILMSEQQLYSKKYGYAGTLDLFINFTLNRRQVWAVVDIKTGEYGAAGIQLSGYKNLLEEYFREAKQRVPIISRYVLHLPKDGGDFVFKPCTDIRDWGMFQARMYQFNYLRR